MLRIFLEVRFFRIYFSMLKVFGNTGISLFRAIQCCTKYDLETRTVDYEPGHNSLCSLMVKKESLGKSRRWRKRKNHLKIILSFIKKYYVCKMRSNYAGMKISGLEITRNKTTCRQVTTSMQLQNRSFQAVFFFKRTAAKCAKLKNMRVTRAKLLVFIGKYANLRHCRLPSRHGYLSSL